MNTNTNSGAPAPTRTKDELVHQIDRTVTSVTPDGDNHVLIGFRGADGKERIASARVERSIPNVGQLARFHGYKVPTGVIEWRLGYAGNANVEAADSAAQA